jgi:hypothetical protein
VAPLLLYGSIYSAFDALIILSAVSKIVFGGGGSAGASHPQWGPYAMGVMFGSAGYSQEQSVSYDRATELERIGGRLVDLPKADWARISTAASSVN